MGSRDSSGAGAARGLGFLLRAQHDGVIREPLPARWVELINCLDGERANPPHVGCGSIAIRTFLRLMDAHSGRLPSRLTT